jgi:hypothetical protein
MEVQVRAPSVPRRPVPAPSVPEGTIIAQAVALSHLTYTVALNKDYDHHREAVVHSLSLPAWGYQQRTAVYAEVHSAIRTVALSKRVPT